MRTHRQILPGHRHRVAAVKIRGWIFVVVAVFYTTEQKSAVIDGIVDVG